MLIDCHTHSRNSFDADNDTVRERCERAIELGLDAMAVTDHCEVNRYYEKEHYHITEEKKYNDYGFKNAFESSMNEIEQAKEEYSGRLNLICGTELGQATSDTAVSDMILSDKRLDYVIASMHELPGHDDFAFLDYSKENVPKLMEKNFNEILKLCQWNKFDILGHLTYALRYIQGEQKINVDMSPYMDIIAEIFRTIIKNGKGIEINTSGLRQAYGKTFPSYEYIKLYRDLGGEIITLGSDCHRTADLAKGISEGIELAKSAGFEKIAYYKKHEPHFLTI
ncbi:histidinol-phosphatase HisJ family protein [Porcipelethomonas sp.]|uniref:histidinol-phosphatase HisJ family protein n=1 Tax=Porcipelethomonas sp. TaxID=2981675 RepID=UPI003EF8D6EA